MKTHIEGDAFAGTRFNDFREEMGWERIQAAGLLTLLWQETQAKRLITGNREEITACVAVTRNQRARVFEVLVACGYLIEKPAGVFEIRGNRKHVDALARFQEIGRRGGIASGKSRAATTDEAHAQPHAKAYAEPYAQPYAEAHAEPYAEPYAEAHASKIEPSHLISSHLFSDQRSSPNGEDQKTKKEDPSTEVAAPPSADRVERAEANRLAWNSYAVAYQKRYGVGPTRNKTVNSQMSAFVQRVGRKDAPGIAGFYVGHADYLYVKNQHPVGLLLRDAEGLRTQWLKGRTVTGAEARETEKCDRLKSQLARIANGEME